MNPRMGAWLSATAAGVTRGLQGGMPLATVLAGWLVGAGAGAFFWLDETVALAQLQDEVQALQARHVPAQPVVHAQPVQPPHGNDEPIDTPGAAQALQVWSWLQQGLQAHDLQLQSLRPGVLEQPAGLPSQTLALELQGRWSDWQAFEHRLGTLAPWWTSEQWQVVPLGDAGDTDDKPRGGQNVGVVKVQWHVRIGWRPGANRPLPGGSAAGRADSADSLPAWLPATTSTTVSAAAAPVQTEPAAPHGMELADADPRRWPVRDLQLKGIWQQQGLAHAVLGRGLQQVVVVPGQRVGREDLRVLRVAETEVILLPADAAGPPLHLSLPGAEK